MHHKLCNNKKSALPKRQVLGVCRNELTRLHDSPLGQGTVIIIPSLHKTEEPSGMAQASDPGACTSITVTGLLLSTSRAVPPIGPALLHTVARGEAPTPSVGLAFLGCIPALRISWKL